MNDSPDLKLASEETHQPRAGGLRTVLLVTGSALLGGLAVVLWNRKTLASLRQPEAASNRPPVIPDEESE
jgi:hypothetical protein